MLPGAWLTVAQFASCGTVTTAGALVAEGKADSDAPLDTGEPDTVGVEICNGLDDDGDGSIDEGFPDYDADGVADCVDVECSVASSEVVVVVGDPACLGVVDAPWQPVVLWQFFESEHDPGTHGCGSTPAAGRYADSDGSGSSGPGDGVRVVVPCGGWDRSVLEGADGTELAWVDDAAVSHAIADVDSDGRQELLALVNWNDPGDPLGVARYDDGYAEDWRSVARTYPPGTNTTLTLLTVADLDSDGTAEILTPYAVFDGATGDERFAMDPPFVRREGDVVMWNAAPADLDGDGDLEVLAGGDAYDADGTLLWSKAPDAATSWSSAINVDADDAAEVLLLGYGWTILDGDGTQLVQYRDESMERMGLPCMADFDGDGVAEFAISSGNVILAFELDGTLAWSAPVEAPWGNGAGCSAFDFDADGAYEVVVMDGEAIRILDGRTGTTQWEDTRRYSSARTETPVIVDLDDDGSVELIETSLTDGGWGGVTAWTHPDKKWPPGGPAWPTVDYSYVDVGDLGEVPRPGSPRPWLIDGGRLRSRPPGTIYGAELSPEAVDDCAASCEPGGRVSLSLRVRNTGIHIATAVVLSATRADGTPAGSVELGDVPGATATASVVLALTVDDFATGPVTVGVDSPAYDDCDPANDVIVVASPCSTP